MNRFKNEILTRERDLETTPGKRKFSIENLWGILFVLPALWLAINFKIYPLIRGLYESFFHFEGGFKMEYVGLDNFIRMFGDEQVRTAFFNAFKIMLTLPVWIIFPLVLAFLIFQRTPGWSFFRAVFFIPYIIAPIIVGQIFRELLNQTGPINLILKSIGLGVLTLSWLSNKYSALWVMISVVLWSFNGLGIVTYLAGFATIPEDIFDAAEIDGAGFWSKIFKIVLPMMWPVIGYWTILCTGGMLLWMFPFILSLTDGGPGYTTMLPEYLVYTTAFKFFERGYGTAIGVALFFLVLIFSIFQVRYMYIAGGGEVRKRTFRRRRL
ncbi:MAG: sugar ABC transporter permease [Actinobacteria bacterium]|nr:sugar ABC transporter permease [Actinomycetota bacterium]